MTSLLLLFKKWIASSLRAQRGNPFLFFNTRNGLLRHSLRSFLAMTIIIFSILPSKSAIEFDGVNDYITLNSTTNLNFGTGDFTITAWLQTIDNRGGTGNYPAILTETSSFGLYLDLGKPLIFPGGTYPGSLVIANNAINNGVWRHIGISRISGTVIIYIDGFIDKSAVSNAAFDLSNGTNIANQSSNKFFNGKIDDVRIYNRALAAAEIEALYKSKNKRPAGSLAKGLVAHYETDDDAINEVSAQIKDSSVNNNYGELKNFSNIMTALNVDVPANIGTGKSLDFDGVNDHVNIPSPSIGNSQSQGSASIWFNPSTTLTSASGPKYMLSKWWGPYLIYDYVDGKLTYVIYNSSNTEYSAGKTINLNSNTWYHAVGVHTATNIYFYLNGVLEDTQSIDMSSPKLNTGTTALGSQYDGNTNFFPGKINQTNIYNKALSASEIAFLYNGSGADPGTTNLQALWTFDDFAPVKDASGNDNHGVGNGGASLKYTEGILKR